MFLSPVPPGPVASRLTRTRYSFCVPSSAVTIRLTVSVAPAATDTVKVWLAAGLLVAPSTVTVATVLAVLAVSRTLSMLDGRLTA